MNFRLLSSIQSFLVFAFSQLAFELSLLFCLDLVLYVLVLLLDPRNIVQCQIHLLCPVQALIFSNAKTHLCLRPCFPIFVAYMSGSEGSPVSTQRLTSFHLIQRIEVFQGIWAFSTRLAVPQYPVSRVSFWRTFVKQLLGLVFCNVLWL